MGVHPLAVKCNDLPVKTTAHALVFLDKSEIKTAITILEDILLIGPFSALTVLLVVVPLRLFGLLFLVYFSYPRWTESSPSSTFSINRLHISVMNISICAGSIQSTLNFHRIFSVSRTSQDKRPLKLDTS